MITLIAIEQKSKEIFRNLFLRYMQIFCQIESLCWKLSQMMKYRIARENSLYLETCDYVFPLQGRRLTL